MFTTLKRFLSVPTVADQEQAYLEQAQDRHDLEYREREISRGKFRTSHHRFQY